MAVLNRDFADPRGWSVLDWDRESADEMAEHGPAFPFIHPTTELLAEHLYEISADTALLLLVALTDDWCNVRNAPGYPEKSECLLADARSLLARYGAQFACYTNVTDARTTKSPDLSHKAPGWISLTQYTADYSLVVVSESEIGVFWSFNPI
ncbi:hypothetical protein ACFYXH_01395 [Streptomyces sp. NPDC002730]|uniref:hypothetical protein n=1 Tax=Streptomyces sp. NPDC002730 TaxID=3364662 RepID=UPI0036D00FCD